MSNTRILCDHVAAYSVEYDFGADENGYHDAGVFWKCPTCGERIDEGDMPKEGKRDKRANAARPTSTI